MKLLIRLLIRFYQICISPILHCIGGPNCGCRFTPTCSEYFIDSLKINGAFKGTILGVKRILRCHPIKFLGGGSGFDPAPNLKKRKK